MPNEASTHRREEEAPEPRDGGLVGGGGEGASASQYSPPGVALAIRKRGRTCVVAKVAPADGELILAIPYRRRPRLNGYVSLPPAVLGRARRMGATALVVRHDREGRAWRLPLALVGTVGRRRADGELYVPLQVMVEIEPPWWPFVERVELLEGEEGRQLPLELEGVDA